MSCSSLPFCSMPGTSMTRTFRISAFTTPASSVTARCSGLCTSGSWRALRAKTHWAGEWQSWLQARTSFHCAVHCSIFLSAFLTVSCRPPIYVAFFLESAGPHNFKKLFLFFREWNSKVRRQSATTQSQARVCTPSMRKRELSVSRRAPPRVS